MGFRNLIVGVTGNVLDDDVDEYLKAGADIVLAKPLKLDLLQTLLNHVKKQGSHSRFGSALVRGNSISSENRLFLI